MSRSAADFGGIEVRWIVLREDFSLRHVEQSLQTPHGVRKVGVKEDVGASEG